MLLQTEGKVCLHSIVNKHRQAVWKRPGWTGWEVLDPLEKKAWHAGNAAMKAYQDSTRHNYMIECCC